MSLIFTLNTGSSSVKFSIYDIKPEPELLLEGQVENMGAAAHLVIRGTPRIERNLGPVDHAGALSAILDAASSVLGRSSVTGVGHRIVHGGTDFNAPVRLDDRVLARLEELSPLAPLHQPHNLEMARAAKRQFPEAVQVGCFDTAFHHGHPWVNDTFALPRKFYDEGVRRYGFHGLSYDYITDTLARERPNLRKSKLVVAHLGNGASMCAIRDGRSVGSTMGFSALDGLPMGTRCGQLDPGVILYLLDHGYTADDIARILFKESGLKGLSGLTHDMRRLLASDAPEARQAVDYYVFRIRRELGAMAAILGGVDALVFCGGIGENAAEIRARVLDGMEFLGLALNAEANAANATEISTGPTEVLVIPTNEERVIARAVAQNLATETALA
ncbi:MAG: acetate/propionate family kinase [Roseobacter sp.]|jgi:acetate kinase|nr:acetate/propionate family kinase [Roseobacter sp.]